MKTLHAIRLVQFYLFEKQDLPIRKVSGVFGPNGSGKSALIDALQIVMTGAHQNYTAFNAQADETRSTSRSLRSYCLGQTSASENSYARDAATTYLTLVWKDDDTGIPTSMGLCITANSNSDKHHVEGRYLLPGVELTLDDHLKASGAGERPLDWNTFRKEIHRQARAAGYEDEIVFNEPMRFVRAYLTALRGSGAIPQAESFLRAFRFGLKMRFDKPVDEIIRYQMLESRPTPVANFRRVLDSVRDLRQRVNQVQDKIKDSENVITIYNEAATLDSQVATAKAVAGRARLLDLDKSVEAAKARLTEAEETFVTLSKEETDKKSQATHAEEEEKRYDRLVQQHSAYQETQSLQEIIGLTNSRLSRAEELAIRQAGQLRACLRVLMDNPNIFSGTADVEALHDDLMELLNGDVQMGKKRVLDTCDHALSLIAGAKTQVDDEHTQHKQALKAQQDELKAVAANLERLRTGKPPLQTHVLRLKNLLEDNGIACMPVCDLVSVSDPSWQPAIEAYLNVHLQGLLVEDHEDRTFALYRRENIHGAKIVRASRNQRTRAPAEGTVAALLEGPHPAAVEYLRSQFGATLCAETDEAALAGERTLTRDGMLTGKTIDRLQCVRPHTFLLGRENKAEQRAEMEKLAARLTTQIEQTKKLAERWSDYRDRFSLIADPEAFRSDLSKTLDDISAAIESLEAYNTKVTDTADAGFLELQERQKQWEAEHQRLRGEIEQLVRRCGAAEQTAINARDSLITIEHRQSEAASRYATLTETPEYDPEAAETQWFELADMQKLHLLAIAESAERTSREYTDRQNKLLRQGSAAFQSYSTKHGVVPPDEAEDWTKLRVWLINTTQALRDSELANYTDRMEEAYKAAQETFRNDVALSIENNLAWLRSTMDRLNKVLENAPAFSNGEYYRFERMPRPEHAQLLDFIRRVSELGPQDDMFGAGEIPPEFQVLLDENTVTGAPARSPLDDYREFFDFDIEIYRRDAERHRVTLGRLSRRIGTGSGGEHRAPLYVIAGAALASAYHLSSNNQDGLALIALDEAFNKMDASNIISTMQYFNDLGLQVMMASPGENLGFLNAFLHGYFNILREADTNMVLLTHHEVTEKARQMFQEDLLEFHPELLDQKLAEMQSSARGTMHE
ncbi:SbcC/MukB-like Walker B domain-containing protein [uncultured Alcanivorax sp.]|jgi:energy-coupling factor transporter ATP-binding protein EcfA2|uniref:SbcC/MukB-like Walker B domain-containing protein n=1 Tax=uncultured Alcanivorax sp. TaxID=191215 RepID=UPI0025FE4D5A|nr:SbcC/MukB-like Walker B domain-containing protein [uncultured Alcanivorax sp.]